MRLTVKPDVRTKRITSSLPASVGAAIIVPLLLVIGWLDYATSTAPVQHLYYVPIVLAAIIFDYWGGLACAITAVVFYHLANQHLRALNYGEGDYLQVSLFLIVAVVTSRLARDRRAIQMLAGTDDLTGLHNLRSFETQLLSTVSRAQTRLTPECMLVLDVDRLKEINDAHGHLAGAEAVRKVGHIIGRELDGRAVACRYGGDEFAILLSETDARASLATAERLRKTVENHAPLLAGRRFPAGTLTISVGIADYFPDGARDPELVGEELFHAADRALYQAKRDGRNRSRLNVGTVPGGDGVSWLYDVREVAR